MAWCARGSPIIIVEFGPSREQPTGEEKSSNVPGRADVGIYFLAETEGVCFVTTQSTE